MILLLNINGITAMHVRIAQETHRTRMRFRARGHIIINSRLLLCDHVVYCDFINASAKERSANKCFTAHFSSKDSIRWRKAHSKLQKRGVSKIIYSPNFNNEKSTYAFIWMKLKALKILAMVMLRLYASLKYAWSIFLKEEIKVSS